MNRLIPDVAQLIAIYLAIEDHKTCCLVSRHWLDIWLPLVWSYDTLAPHTTTAIPAFRRNCHRLQHFFYEDTLMGREQFDSDILGRDESWVGNEDRPLNIRRGSRAEANKIIFNRHNAFLSDSLRTMNYRINPQACLHIMHWLGLAARRAHRLNNLEELTLRWTYLIVHKREREEICIDLASLLLFVKSSTNLKKMQILLGVIFDNITSTSTKPIDPSASNSELLSPVLPPPLWTSNLTGLGFYQLDSTAVLEKILAHTPALTSFSIAYMDETGYLTALKHNCPQLTSLHCPVKVYNIKAEDWTDFFRHMPKLEALRFGYSAVELDDRAIFTLAENCPNFRELVLEIAAFSWHAAHALLVTHACLEVLELGAHVVSINEIAVDPCPWACYSTLQRLKINGGMDLDHTDADQRTISTSLRAHLQRLRNLESLWVGETGLLTQIMVGPSEQAGPDVQAPAVIYPNLTHMYLTGLRDWISVADMKFLVQAVPELSWLDVSGAHDVEVVDWIDKYHPYLDSAYRSIYW